MNKMQVRDVMQNMEREPPGSSIILPLQEKGERDTARILFYRYIQYITDHQYPLYKYCFRIRSTSLSRDGVNGFAIERLPLRSHQLTVIRARTDGIGKDLDIITDPTLVSLVKRQAEMEADRYFKANIYYEVLDEQAPQDIKDKFVNGKLEAKEMEKYVKLESWTKELKDTKIKEIEERLWDGDMLLDYAYREASNESALRGVQR